MLRLQKNPHDSRARVKYRWDCPDQWSEWPCVGDNFVGAATSSVGTGGVAAASPAACSQTDDAFDSQMSSLAAIRDKTATGGPPGRMNCSSAETRGKNGVDRHRWRLHQTPVPEANFENRRDNRWSTSQGCRAPRLATEAQKGTASRPRATTQVRQENNVKFCTCLI